MAEEKLDFADVFEHFRLRGELPDKDRFDLEKFANNFDELLERYEEENKIPGEDGSCPEDTIMKRNYEGQIFSFMHALWNALDEEKLAKMYQHDEEIEKSLADEDDYDHPVDDSPDHRPEPPEVNGGVPFSKKNW